MKITPILHGAIVAAGVSAASAIAAGPANAADVLTYHNNNTRHGLYTVPGLTTAAAAGMHLDPAFSASFVGDVYAQPLYWKPSGAAAGLIIVATESNLVYALNANTGAIVWQVQLPAPVTSGLPCGNINPEGITGTPVIDPETGTLYLNSLAQTANGPRHMIYGLSLTDGSTRAGWPVDVQAVLAARGTTFSSSTEAERSAVLLFGGNLYVNYGARSGDCGTYYGVVVQLTTQTPGIAAYWATRARGGGIWSQGGLAGDGASVFVTTGNTFGATSWGDGEAIERLKPGLAHSTSTKDYFAPTNWKTLDNEDLDLGGTEALPIGIGVAGSQGAARVIAFGKDGNAYLVNRGNLGGIGGQIATTAVSNSAIITAPAVYSTPTTTMVAFENASGKSCSGANITMLNIAASGASPISTAWCAASGGRGSPIITTTDGTSDPIVWEVGAESDNMLHGFNAMTGAVVFGGGGIVMQGLRHFQTLIAAQKHLYVAADGRVYSFTY